MNNRPSLALVFGLLVLALLLGALRLWQGNFQLQGNLLALLPTADEAGAARLASQRLSEHLGDEFLLLVVSEDSTRAQSAAKQLRNGIAASENFEIVSAEQQLASHLEHLGTLRRHSAFLLTDQQEENLASNRGEALLQNALAAAYDLTATGGFVPLSEDPLGLFNQYLLAATPYNAAIETVDGIATLRAGQKTFALVHGSASSGAFNLDAQQEMVRLEEQLLTRPDNSGVAVLRAGAIFHASRAAATTRKEIALIATGSCLGILLLFIAAFRSVRPLLLGFSSIAFGCVSALILCWNLYGTLHLLTLVFGASLIGVAIDYALHFLVRSHGGRPHLPGLGLALLTSSLGYGSLLQAPLPGLQEMALFSIIGLLASGLYVAVLFPRLAPTTWDTRSAALRRLATFPPHLWQHRYRWVFAGLLLLPLLALPRLQFNNDLKIFHTLDQQLLDEQAQIDQILPGRAPNQYFLIRGETPEDLLQSAEAFRLRLRQLVREGAIADYALISDSLPSVQRQQENRQLLMETVYRPGGEAEVLFDTLGFHAEARSTFRARLAAAQPMQPEQWLETAPPEERLLWLGQYEGAYFSIVMLTGVQALGELQRAAAEIAGVEFTDTVSELSASLQARSRSAGRLLLFAYAAIGVLLLLRYRRAGALRLLLLPAGSSLLAIAVLSAAGIPLTLFHVFALYLILGLGMDYGIFLRESGPQSTSCQIAILLSVLTSSLSFGLLALTSTPMIAAFGLTVMLGGLGNWLLSPLAVEHSRQA